MIQDQFEEIIETSLVKDRLHHKRRITELENEVQDHKTKVAKLEERDKSISLQLIKMQNEVQIHKSRMVTMENQAMVYQKALELTKERMKKMDDLLVQTRSVLYGDSSSASNSNGLAI